MWERQNDFSFCFFGIDGSHLDILDVDAKPFTAVKFHAPQTLRTRWLGSKTSKRLAALVSCGST